MFSGCLNKDLYSKYGPFFKNAYKTKDNRALLAEGFKDTIFIENNIPVKGAYFAIIKGEFTHVLDTIIQWGHVWSTKDSVPYINDPKDTSLYSRFYLDGRKPIFDTTFIFKSYVALYPETRFWVRSYVITSRGDTGYMPNVYSDISLPPINEWFFNDKDGTQLDDREGSCIFSVVFKGETKIFLACGNNGNQVFGDIFEFNKTLNKWQQFYSDSRLRRTEAIGFAIVERNANTGQDEIVIYVGTGDDGFGNLKNDFYRIPYNNPQQITQIAANLSFTLPLRSAIAFTINNVPYFGLGYTSANNQSISSMWKFDYTKLQKYQNPFIALNETFPTARENACVFIVSNIAFIGLGYNKFTNTYYKDFYMFSPPSITGVGASFTRIPDFPGSERSEAVAFGLDFFGYAGLGYNGSYQKDFYRYNPFAMTWDLLHPVKDYKDGPDYNLYGTSTIQNVKNACAFGLIRIENGEAKKQGFVTGGKLDNNTFTRETWFYRPW